MNKIAPVIILIITIVVLFSCNKKISLIGSDLTINSKVSIKKPYVILISLDGFRWDYVERFKPPHLSAFIENGVRSESLIPSFPSKTFPNHYSIATGMYPDNHGLLGNSYYNYEKDATYTLRDRAAVQDGTWYKGTPIWVQAAKSGMVTASYFFVGSEADIQGIRPTYYYDYDGSVQNQTRVDQAVDWLRLAAEKRPHLITMYFSDMDDTGHRFGPNDDEKLKEALFSLDAILGNLFKRVAETKLPVNIIIVSDHGMMEVSTEQYLPVEMLENDDLYLTVNNGAIVNIHPKDDHQIDSIYNYLKQKEDHFKVYKTENAPYFEYVPKNKNWGSIQVIPESPYYFVGIRTIGLKKGASQKIFGQHGFDTNLKEMHGIFYANGSAFKEGYVVPSVKNIHIYPLICEILGLKIPADIDGDLNELKGVLK